VSKANQQLFGIFYFFANTNLNRKKNLNNALKEETMQQLKPIKMRQREIIN